MAARVVAKGRLQRHPELQQVRQEAIESTLDLAESQLLKLMKGGNLTAIIFFLKCKGKACGYVERQQIEGVKPKVSSEAVTLAAVFTLEELKDYRQRIIAYQESKSGGN